jgi:hypothetical protein
LQRTANGLLLWRRGENWTGFTDGATTWVLGPDGLQQRPIHGRFAWEVPPGPDSGVEGDVTIGAGCPGPDRPEPDCMARLALLRITILDQAGRGVARAPVGPGGDFRAPLPPGGYTLHPDLGPWINASDRPFSVAPGRFTRVQIGYQSGIR